MSQNRPAAPAPVDAKLPFGRIVLRIAFDRDNIYGIRLMRVNFDGKPEIAGQVPADFLPGFTAVIAAVDIPVLLHEQDVRARRVHRNTVNAVADVRVRVGKLVCRL